MKQDNEQFFFKNGINGLLLVPLVLWFIYTMIMVLKQPENQIPILFLKPVNVIFGILFFVFIGYHINFEIIYLIRNFTKNIEIAKKLSIAIYIISFMTTLMVVLAILQLHFNSILLL